MIRAKLLTTVSAVALASPVMAADIPARMPVKAPAPVVAAAPSWAGLYIGGSLGAVWHELKFEELGELVSPLAVSDGRKAGIIGGGHIGYNWQVNSLVFGVEADISGASARVSFVPFAIGPAASTITSRLNWLATFRGRAGVTAGSTLFFGTAGLAVGGVENLRTFLPGGLITEIGEGKATRTGWVAGGGIEHMLNRNWIVRAEALYVDLGKKTLAPVTVGDTYVSRFTNTEVIARGAVIFKW
jgi:outer membrane immunogenic protein